MSESSRKFNIGVSIKGLNTDFKIDALEEGDYPYALNAVSRDNLQFLTNDLSNQLCVELPGDVIGSLYIDYDTYILFLANNSIVELNVNKCEYTTLLQLDCLNFKITKQITAAYTTLNDCNQRVIYWTDNENPIRFYNLDTDEVITDCKDLMLNLCDIVPVIGDINVLNNGGYVQTGTHQFVVSFGKLNDNNAPVYTNWYAITNPISITDDDLNSSFWAIDGADGGNVTNKSIDITITGLPQRYNIIRIAVISTTQQVTTVRLVQITNYSGNTYFYKYTGNESQTVVLPLEEIIVSKINYLKAKDLLIKDNRLILANLKTIKNINYQKYANDIKVNYITKKVRIDTPPFAYKNPEFIYDSKSWMRDEVYSLAIVWEFCDGSYSRAFHIPGRQPNCFDYRIDDEGNQVTTDFEGLPLCDNYLVEDDVNAIDCELDKWKNRNTSIRTELNDCPQGTPYYEWVYEPQFGQGLCSGCVSVTAEVIPCDDVCGSYATAWGPYNDVSGCYEYFSIVTGTFSGIWYVYTLPIDDLSVSGFTLIEESFEPPYKKWRGCGNEITSLNLENLEGYQQQLCNPIQPLDCIYSKGELAYHQSCERYPLVKDCDGNYMFPTELDNEGNVRGQFIRHHKMPDSINEPHYSVLPINDAYVEKQGDNLDGPIRPYSHTYIYPLGLDFSNISIPDDIPIEFIKGFKIVYVNRTEANKSIIAKGLMFGTFMDFDENASYYLIPKHGVNSYEYWAYPGGGGTHAEAYDSTALDKKIVGGYTFISPNTTFVSPDLNTDYLKLEWEFYGRGDVYGDTDEWDNNVDFCDNGENYGRRQNYNLNQRTYTKNPNTNKFQINRLIKDAIYAPANQFVENTSKLTHPLNNTNRESSVYFELNSKDLNDHLRLVNFYNDYESDSQSPNIGNTPIQDVDTSFWKHEWDYNVPCPPCNDVRQRAQSKWSAATWYGSLKKINCAQYGKIENSFYIETGMRKIINVPNTIEKYSISGFYGDSFINYFAIRRTSRIGRRDNDDNGYNGTNFEPRTLKTLLHFIVESDINVDYRQEGLILKDTYYPKLKNRNVALDSSIPAPAKPLNAYLNRFYYDTCTEEVTDFVDNYYGYNIDYSGVNDKRVFTPITQDYKTCDCIGELPNTVAYSNKTNLNNFNLNNFLESNYVTIPSNFGSINNIFSLNNQLYAHTRDIIWKVFSNEKQLKLDDTTVYIGQGDLFAKDPISIYASNVGYAGNILQHGILNTETGYYFYDIYGGKIHHFTDKLDDLSLKKMTNFFKNNSSFCIDVNKDNFANPEGIGVMFIYDYYNNRLLMTKKNYEFKDESQYGGIYQENNCEIGKIYFNANTNRFVYITDIDCSYDIISVKDEQYFCDKSYTLSYSYNLDAWTSFHSFIPDYYLYNRNNFYSIKDRKVYSHNTQCNHTTYYDNIYPYIIELPILNKPDINATTFTSLHWNSLAQICDVSGNVKYANDKTFNKLLLYNSYQSTGYLDLIYNKGGYLRVEPPYPSINLDRNEKHFSINNIRDYTGNYDLPMFKHDCQFCSRDVNKYFNNDRINPNKFYKELQRMRDTFMIARFELHNTNNIKLTMDYLITSNTKSIR